MQRLNHSLCLRGASCFSGAKVLLKLAVTFFSPEIFVAPFNMQAAKLFEEHANK